MNADSVKTRLKNFTVIYVVFLLRFVFVQAHRKKALKLSICAD